MDLSTGSGKYACVVTWKAANALLGETAPERTAWVEARTLQMLKGQIQAVILDLAAIAAHTETSKTARQTLISVAAYYERNQGYMQYDQ